jgi:hypothetical protein
MSRTVGQGLKPCVPRAFFLPQENRNSGALLGAGAVSKVPFLEVGSPEPFERHTAATFWRQFDVGGAKHDRDGRDVVGNVARKVDKIPEGQGKAAVAAASNHRRTDSTANGSAVASRVAEDEAAVVENDEITAYGTVDRATPLGRQLCEDDVRRNKATIRFVAAA